MGRRQVQRIPRADPVGAVNCLTSHPFEAGVLAMSGLSADARIYRHLCRDRGKCVPHTQGRLDINHSQPSPSLNTCVLLAVAEACAIRKRSDHNYLWTVSCVLTVGCCVELNVAEGMDEEQEDDDEEVGPRALFRSFLAVRFGTSCMT